MLLQKQPSMRALRRSKTSLGLNSNTTSSSHSSSWLHLRSVLLIVAPSSPVSSDRGSLKSPWSRRRRKHALLSKQWKSSFDVDGKFSDGGVRFLKKVRTGGVEPSIRAEVWPFPLGMYDLNSTQKDRDAIRAQKRREYVYLRRQCCQISKHCERSFKSKKISGDNSNEDSSDICHVLDSPGLEEIASARPSISMDGLKLYHDTSKELMDQEEGEEEEEEEEEGVITNGNVSEAETQSFDSECSEYAQDTKPLLSSMEIDNSNVNEPAISTLDTSETKPTNCKSEDFAAWQRIIRLDALRANPEWTLYPPSQASVSEVKAQRLAESVGLKDYDHLEPCRIYHAARLVAILEAYAVYDPETGYCQGMSDLLSPIISVIREDHVAFWCFVGFMRKARHNFRLDEVGIKRQLSIVSKIIKCKDSHLYKHLEKLQAEDCFFVYRMVVVLFRRELTFEQTLCLWEVMWADQASIRAGISESGRGKLRLKAPPNDDLLLYAIAASVLQKRKLIIEKYSSMDEIMRECNGMAGHLDVWKLLDDAHELVVTLHEKI